MALYVEMNGKIQKMQPRHFFCKNNIGAKFAFSDDYSLEGAINAYNASLIEDIEQVCQKVALPLFEAAEPEILSEENFQQYYDKYCDRSSLVG